MSKVRMGLLTAVALAATIPSIASAQDEHGDRPQRGADRGDRGGRPDMAAPREDASRERGFARNEGAGRMEQQRPQERQVAQQQPQPPQQAQPQARPDDRQRNYAGMAQQPRGDDRRFDGRPGPAAGQDFRGDNRPGFANGRPGFAQNDRRYDPRWNNNGPQGRVGGDWRNDRRYDWQNYRNANRQQFRVGRYQAPRGWSYGYQRFSIGFRLSPFLYSSNYWIDDPYAYRLPPVWGSYRWVRYYDDVLLIDTVTGTVVDAIPNFFW